MGNKINHLGVIMDGNRRWAKLKNMPTINGHAKGARNLFKLCDWCIKEEIKYVTVYVFSTYNWNRTKKEIDDLFNLMKDLFYKEIEICIQKEVCVNILGDYSVIDIECKKVLDELQISTKDCKKLQLNMAINYGGREDIIRGIKNIVLAYDNDFIINNLTEEIFKSFLYTNQMPEIDLIIRTGGYQRISNFFIWQSACAELYFTKTLWPDFNHTTFTEAIDFYNNITINNGK